MLIRALVLIHSLSGYSGGGGGGYGGYGDYGSGGYSGGGGYGGQQTGYGGGIVDSGSGGGINVNTNPPILVYDGGAYSGGYGGQYGGQQVGYGGGGDSGSGGFEPSARSLDVQHIRSLSGPREPYGGRPTAQIAGSQLESGTRSDVFKLK